MNCRHCDSTLKHTFLDLASSPPSNSYLTLQQLSEPETYYPLKLYVCTNCWLVQTEDHASAASMFNATYAYFSSTSASWLNHAREYSRMIVQRLGLNSDSFVVEIAANDGYLLQNFVAAGVPCLGVEPTLGTATAAEAKRVPIKRAFFGASLAEELLASHGAADLVIGNNVYAHVPNINDFTLGLKRMLAKSGTITLEFPHLLQLMTQRQFDTIYHEHFSYLSLAAVTRIFAKNGLRVFDAEELSTHGGSLRVYGCHANDSRAVSNGVARIVSMETRMGLQRIDAYAGFQKQVEDIKNEFLLFLLAARRSGQRIAGYGAAAKGNTLLNFAGVKRDLLPYVCDAASAKQGMYLPGSHIPVLAPSTLIASKPNIVLILPWNIADEVVDQMAPKLPSDTRFAVAIPAVKFVTG